MEARPHEGLLGWGGSASGCLGSSHRCYDSTVHCHRLWKGVEGRLECAALCTTQSHSSFAQTQVAPRECLATHVLLSKEVANRGVTAINTTCDEQGL